MKKPTVMQIAEACGVSVATVSQVLNNRGQRFRPSTRERIWRAALEAGYRPHPAEQAQRSGHMGSVGLVLGHPSGSHLPDALLRGLSQGLSEVGSQLVVAILDETRGERLVDLERRLGVDGLLINRHQEFGDDLLRQRNELSLPTIWLNADLATDTVGPDDHAAGQAAAHYLLAQKVGQLAWIDVLATAQMRNGYHSGVRRAAGVQAIAEAAGVSGCSQSSRSPHWRLGGGA
jgi:LacI family transcriptional regulator